MNNKKKNSYQNDIKLFTGYEILDFFAGLFGVGIMIFFISTIILFFLGHLLRLHSRIIPSLVCLITYLLIIIFLSILKYKYFLWGSIFSLFIAVGLLGIGF